MKPCITDVAGVASCRVLPLHQYPCVYCTYWIILHQQASHEIWSLLQYQIKPIITRFRESWSCKIGSLNCWITLNKSQITKRLENFKHRSHAFETMWDLTMRCLMWCWNNAEQLVPAPSKMHSYQISRTLRCCWIFMNPQIIIIFDICLHNNLQKHLEDSRMTSYLQVIL